MNYQGTTASEIIQGTQESDNINGGGGNDTVVGGQDSLDGADMIITLGGADIIFGNGGADTISSGSGDDVLIGGAGADLLIGNQGNDLSYGNMGNDTIISGMGDDTVYAGQGDDFVSGGDGSNLINGNLGNDTAGGYGAQSGYTWAKDNAGSVLLRNNSTGAIDTLVNMEYVSFSDGTRSMSDLFPTPPGPPEPPAPPFMPNNAFTFNGSIPVSDQKANGDFSSGNGTPSTHFNGVTNANNGVHIFTQISYREVSPPIVPISSTQDGVTLTNNYQAAAGTQSTANGSSTNRADRAATSDYIDIGTDVGSLADFLAGGGRFERSYDTDRSAAVNAVTAEARLDAVNGNVDWFVKGSNTAFQTDDGGDNNTSANSFNRLFIPGISAADLVSGSQFTDTLTAFDGQGHVLAAIVNNTTLV